MRGDFEPYKNLLFVCMTAYPPDNAFSYLGMYVQEIYGIDVCRCGVPHCHAHH